MPLGVPILGQDDVGKGPGKFVAEGNGLITAGHRQRAAGTEIILNIDDDQDV